MTACIGRRDFITLLGGAAAWPLAAQAQSGKMPTIGYLGANTPAAMSQWTAAFVQRLRELGWIEGRNVAIEYRWAEGRLDRSPELIAELVRLKVDVIVTHATVNVLAAKGATSVIPIVFASVADPVANNVVASLARPGGNITGLSAQISEVAGKRLEILREIVPDLRRLAIMANVDNPSAVLETREDKQRRARSGSRPRCPKSGGQTISGLPSRRSRTAQTPFMFSLIRPSPPTGFSSIRWRCARDCRRCTVLASCRRGRPGLLRNKPYRHVPARRRVRR
jgi:putative tryptophan/tyrosine transport system substrate-binding protein